MPGITPSRYVRGIPNPHSAYASAEIPENVTIFKNLSRWHRRQRRRQYPFRNFVTVTTTALMIPDAIRAHRRAAPSDKGDRRFTLHRPRVYAGANSCSRKSTRIHILTSVANVRSLDLLPLKIITPFLEQKPASSPTSRSFLLEPPLLL